MTLQYGQAKNSLILQIYLEWRNSLSDINV